MNLKMFCLLLSLFLINNIYWAQTGELEDDTDIYKLEIQNDSVHAKIKKQKKRFRALGIIKINITGTTLLMQIGQRMNKGMINGQLESVIINGDSLIISLTKPTKDKTSSYRHRARKSRNSNDENFNIFIGIKGVKKYPKYIFINNVLIESPNLE